MPASNAFPGWKDKILFTPGPLTTSRTVKQAMLNDLGSRDTAFIGIVREIRDALVGLGGAKPGDYEAVLMQGSGTFAVEAVLTSTTPPDGKVLIVANGAYGKRMAKICSVAKIDHALLSVPEHDAPTPQQVQEALAGDDAITNVAIVHCETTTGIMNPIKEIGEVVRAAGKTYLVDAMSCFGAVPTNLAECSVDFLVSSANKCIEGVPGFGFILARHDALLATEGFARSLSLDILEQWRGLEGNGQFRFTPPTHALLAFRQALRELEQEGGVEGRGARYHRNYEVLVEGMRAMGFKEYLPPESQGYIITSFRYPEDSKFDFDEFYRRLNDRDQVIYPGKVSDADCFRIGNIGRIFEADVRTLLSAIRDVVGEMGFKP